MAYVRKGLTLLVLVSVFLVLASCGSGIREGTVISRRYEPVRIWYTTVYDYANVPYTTTQCSGTPQTCRTVTNYRRQQVGSHQEQHIDDEDWYLTLDDGEHRDEVEVEKWQYDQAKPGQWYSLDGAQ